jgi:hypothetical protein
VEYNGVNSAGEELLMSVILLLFGLTLATILILALLGVGYFYIVKKSFQKSGVSELAEHYPVQYRKGPFNSSFLWRTASIGGVQWRRCVDIAVLEEGLYLAVKQLIYPQPPALIPWSEMNRYRETRLYYRAACEINVGEPPVSRIVLFREVFEKMKPYLDLPERESTRES